MKYLFEFFNENYYTSLILILLAIVAIRISVRNRKENNLLKFIPAYLIFSVFQSLFNFLVILDLSYEFREACYKINNYIILSFVVFEAFVFGNLFAHIITSKVAKKIIQGATRIFPIAITLTVISNKVDHQLFTAIYLAETGFLLIPCIIYYIEVLGGGSDYKVPDQTTFWIITGLTSFLVTTLPYVTIQDYIFKVNNKLFDQLQTLIYLPYCIFFLLIIKAYKCPRHVNMQQLLA